MSCSKNIRQIKREQLGRALAAVEYQHLDTQSRNVLAAKLNLVELIRRGLQQCLQDSIVSIDFVGSNAEGTALATSGYDLHCNLKLPGLGVVEKSEDESYMKVYNGPKELLNDQGCLSTVEAISMFRRRIDCSLQNNAFSLRDEPVDVHVSPQEDMDTIKLPVSCGTLELNINISVALKCEHLRKSYSIMGFPNDLVAKPSKSYGRSDLWKVSYSRNERDKLSGLDGKKRTLLQLMKVIRQYQPELRRLPTFFYKHALLKMLKDQPNASWSSDSDLPERFKDMVKVIFCAVSGSSLPCVFDKSINCLKNLKDARLPECAQYLGKIITNDEYAKLVGVVPTTFQVPDRVLKAYDEDEWGCALM